MFMKLISFWKQCGELKNFDFENLILGVLRNTKIAMFMA